MQPAKFLDKYKYIIFDMDGVITSEQNYWVTAALTVWELFFDISENDVKTLEKNAKNIRNIVFNNDKTIIKLKELGVNTNWDLAFVVLMVAFLIKSKENVANEGVFQKAYDYILKINSTAPQLYDDISNELCKCTGKTYDYLKREGELWVLVQDAFQSYYMGDKIYKEFYNKNPKIQGKTGLMNNEEPIIEINKLEKILTALKNSGKVFGVGTGRQYIEINEPLMNFGIKKYFDEKHFVTYTDVVLAQENLKNNYNLDIPLSKPHPYMFLKSVLSKSYDDYKIINFDFDKKILEKALVIGDAGSDIISAQKAGIDFLAVLTGVSGINARDYFEKQGANYILNSIEELIYI